MARQPSTRCCHLASPPPPSAQEMLTLCVSDVLERSKKVCFVSFIEVTTAAVCSGVQCLVCRVQYTVYSV